MQLTTKQIKGRLKNISLNNCADARILMRIYMMERFLERLSISRYKDNFIIKGGMLITSLVGVSMRSTMDIDTSIKGFILSIEEVSKIINEIKEIDLNDNIIFEVKDIFNIMDEMEYPGIRISLNAYLEKVITPFKIDISTGDIITPSAIQYEYNLLLEKRTITLWSYNLETILAEKLQTILTRGILNTRMRDFYDIHILLEIYGQNTDIDFENLKYGFRATCQNRKTENLLFQANEIVSKIENDYKLQKLWKLYQKKYSYARNIAYTDTVSSVKKLVNKVNDSKIK